MKNEYDFQVGDKVTCLSWGEGTIILFTECAKYPIEVEFKNGHIEIYTFDGRQDKSGSRTLFHGWDLKITVEEKTPVRYPWVNIFDYGRGLEAGLRTYKSKEEAEEVGLKTEPFYRFTTQLKPPEEV
jgi:hypothetical protein